EGISASDVSARREREDLVLQIAGGTDEVKVENYFGNDDHWKLDAIEFTDGTTWNPDTIKALVQQATDGDDRLIGYAADDVLSGGQGNDSLLGKAGDDQLAGGAGADSLSGGEGSDALAGSQGS